MNAKLGNVLAALSMIGVLVSATPAAMAARYDTLETREPAPNAALENDHEALARYHEDAAARIQVKIEEQKELLEQYEKIRLYGWQSHNLKSRTSAMIRKLEQAERSHMKEAASHHQMALRLKESDYLYHSSLHRGPAAGEASSADGN
jgi:hypothetical protein